ncbi:MAG TPA: ABC transporter permease [Verrucomicrobiae bacterium]|jgi:ABC-2 type transport system permease protein
MHFVNVLLYKDSTHFRRDHGRLVLTFLVPLVFIYMFGQIFGVNRGNKDSVAVATQLVGGWAMQFLLFALMAASMSLFAEKDRGLFQRILSGPVPRSAILWSKFLYGVAIGLFQLMVLFVAGRLLFNIDIVTHAPSLVLVCICAAGACSAFGMMLASFATTSDTAQGLSAMCILVMSALGGAWFPIRFMPQSMQHLSRFTLVYWSIEGFVQVLWEHVSFGELLQTIGILVGITGGLLAIAWWRFSRGQIFD